MKVELLKNVKYQGESFRKGQSIEADPKDIEEMIAKQVIAANTEVSDSQEDEKPAKGRRKKEAEADADADTTSES